MTAPRYPTEEELHAFIDHELDASRRAEIMAVLRDDPLLAARVVAYEADGELLRVALGGVAEQPVPAAWAARIEAAMAPRHGMVATRRNAIAASVALAISAAAAARWQWGGGDGLLAEAESARDGRLVGRPMPAELQPPASRDALLRSTLGMLVRVPDLQRFGFHLANMDVFDGAPNGAAQLRYLDVSRRLLTIYVRRSDGTVRFDLLRRDSTRVCVWQDDVVGAVIIAPVTAGEMLRIASRAYSDLNL
jgi:anti-sigma factor RsiW